MGDISLLQPDDRNVEGVNASVRTYEKIKGVGSVFGDFTFLSSGCSRLMSPIGSIDRKSVV